MHSDEREDGSLYSWIFGPTLWTSGLSPRDFLGMGVGGCTMKWDYPAVFGLDFGFYTFMKLAPLNWGGSPW